MEAIFDALDRFGREVTALVSGADYVGAHAATVSGREWWVYFTVDGVEFRLNVDDGGAWLFHDAGSIHYANGDWRALLAERFGGAK
jgi:hypothetical protein